MKFEKMIEVSQNEFIIVAGRPAIGKTTFAIKQAECFINSTGKDVLLVVGTLPSIHTLSTLDKIDLNIRNKIHICEEIYKLRSCLSIRNRIENICAENSNIGLIIIDDDIDFEYKEQILVNSLSTPVIHISHVDRRADRRKDNKPILKDINKLLTNKADKVYALYIENYFVNYEEDKRFLKVIELK